MTLRASEMKEEIRDLEEMNEALMKEIDGLKLRLGHREDYIDELEEAIQSVVDGVREYI